MLMAMTPMTSCSFCSPRVGRVPKAPALVLEGLSSLQWQLRLQSSCAKPSSCRLLGFHHRRGGGKQGKRDDPSRLSLWLRPFRLASRGWRICLAQTPALGEAGLGKQEAATMKNVGQGRKVGGHPQKGATPSLGGCRSERKVEQSWRMGGSTLLSGDAPQASLSSSFFCCSQGRGVAPLRKKDTGACLSAEAWEGSQGGEMQPPRLLASPWPFPWRLDT